MDYRIIGRTGKRVSVIGLGGEWLNGLTEEEVATILDYAMEKGVNILDVFMPQEQVRSCIGKALENKRDKMIIQGHLCTVYENGQYERTRDLEKTKASFEDLLIRLKTDYIDIGMIHYVDTIEDFTGIFQGEIIEYVKHLKAEGKIKSIGISSHNPVVALEAVKTGLIDVLMFSINAAYDLEQSETDIYDLMEFKDLEQEGWQIDDARAMLYSTCEKLGVGITVMKALAAGSLLKAETSPFKKPMTVSQCTHYCLTRPGVVSVLIGCHTRSELEQALTYLEASHEEKDYAPVISDAPKFQMNGRCMYCNHCQPCPVQLDIAAITKYLHLAQMQEEVPETVARHYQLLDQKASACIQCGQCEPNCPFGVAIRENMRQAQQKFGY